MLRDLPTQEQTSADLRELVKISVHLLGRVIEDSVGTQLYRRIESIRKKMAGLRDKNEKETLAALRSALSRMERMSVSERRVVARAFTLMLELINTCENAYRSYRLAQHAQEQRGQKKDSVAKDKPEEKPSAIIYVLTAHPTEARAPENIAVFHLIQRQLVSALEKKRSMKQVETEVRHLLELAWRTLVVRERTPAVSDEAEHVYSTLLERSTLDSLLEASHEIVPVYVRSWVGGDKDGHPGVNESIMQKSLSLSRSHLIEYAQAQLGDVLRTLQLLRLKPLQSELSHISRSLRGFRKVRNGDGARMTALRRHLNRVFDGYKREFGLLHPGLRQLRRLMHVFPAFVVPLELRESSDVLLSDQTGRSRLTIDRMLEALARLSRGGDPRWYARGFIVSMTSSLEHLQVADRKVRRAFGRAKIPVIPLFEEADALNRAPEIVRQWLQDPRMGRDVREEWAGDCEMMLGYSDSAKETGVLASRLGIAEAMHRLERLCRSEHVQPVFFQGSGGSVDRGGGSVQDQTAWWPHSALKIYKVTLQGEMVERSLASPEITRGQITRIARSAGESLARPSRPPHLAAIRDFAASVASAYKEMVSDPEFLELVEKATPYSDLGELRFGSRPVRRAERLSVKGLRAIPWVLCWTQTRVLFPTWWGVGLSWRKSDQDTRKALRQAFAEEPVFASYLRALGFTLAKVELMVWRIYLERSGLDRKLVDRYFRSFEQEFASVLEMVRFISGEADLFWFRHWLGASIRLRSPMIHPLNLLQILALKEKDFALLRLTVSGISSGMLTTG